MAYLGIGYTGSDNSFLKTQIENHIEWLKGDRLPRLYGECFLILYDSNTAREFAKKCKEAAEKNTITIYQIDRTIK